MARSIKAKQLAAVWGQFHSMGKDLKVEYRKAGATHILSDVRPADGPNGKPTLKTIQAVEDGREKFYDGNYDFEVTKLLTPTGPFEL